MTAEDFGQLPFVESPTLSPDGKRWAGLAALKGTQVIVIINLYEKPALAVRVPVGDGIDVRWVRWANNDNVLFGVSSLMPVDTRDWYITRVVALNRISGKLTRLLWDLGGQNGDDVIWTPQDNSDEVLIAAQNSIYDDEEYWPAVYRVNVTTGRGHSIVRPHAGVMSWYADASGEVRAGVGYNDSTRTSTLLYRRTGGSTSFRTIDRANERKEERLLHPFAFLPGGDHALVIHDNADGRSALYEVDLATREDVRTIYDPPAGEIEGVMLAKDSVTPLGVTLSDLHHSVHWFDQRMENLQIAFQHAVPSASAAIVSTNDDHTHLLIDIGGADMPGMLYYYDVELGAMQRLANLNEAIGTQHLSPVKIVSYKARDGLDIEAILTVPGGRDPHNLPIVVFPHGGPWARDRWSYDYIAQFIAHLGYVVLQPNFRGSTGYGTSFLHAADGQMGLAMQDDLSDGLKWAVDQGLANPKRACIAGASYGGYAAMWGIAKDPDQYRCAISIAGVSSLKREVNGFWDTLNANLGRDAWQRMTPDFDAVSPLNAVQRIKAPLLLIHGKKDVTVQVVQSEKMNERMKSAGKNVELVERPLADHYYTRQEDRIAMLKAIETFLRKYNPPD